MNVFMITSVPLAPPWDQGDKNLAYALTQALGEHRFRVLGLRRGPFPAGDNLQLEPVFTSYRPSLWQKTHLYGRLLAQRAVGNGVSSCGAQPDLYHLIYQPTALSSWMGRRLPEFRRRPLIHTVPAVVGAGELSRGLFFADRLVVLSRHALAVLRRLELENLACIPPGVEVARWAGLRARREAAKERLGLAGRPVLLYPGHYAPGYGLGTLLRALPALRDRFPDLQVLCACRLRTPGDRKRETAVRRALAGQGLAGHVRFFNTVADMSSLVSASDLTLLPMEVMKDKIDLPITLLESLACGVPIVVTTLPSLAELLDGVDGGAATGLAIPPGDSGALVESVSALLEDASLRAQMGDRAQALVRERYDIRRVAGQYEELYRDALR